MNTKIISVSKYTESDPTLVLVSKSKLNSAKALLNKKNSVLLDKAAKNNQSFAILSQNSRWIIVEMVADKAETPANLENVRRNGGNRVKLLRDLSVEELVLIADVSELQTQAYVEGLVLANYQFNKYFSKPNTSCFTTLKLHTNIARQTIKQWKYVLEGVCEARDLVNEPLSYLTAPQLSKEIQRLGKSAGFSVKVLQKAAIEKLKMGGLLAVNKGSVDPPTFSILEWKPKNAKNKQPIVLVGKGVVYDTGGLSLKPTGNSMDFMKSDMGGAAIVAGTMYAAAKCELPLHIIGLVPATDNRPGGNAYAPGDVIKMHSGSTVEVLNTDAEGRMLLADALHYAKQYKPSLVCDFATLTGAAARSIGPIACAVMGTAGEEVLNSIKSSGQHTYERAIEFPLWKEYGDMLKSDIADLKNIGGAYSGAITAGKFLEHFTDYPWVHFDVAGTAFTHTEDSYKMKGGTGFGVRLLIDFLKKQ